MSMRGWGGVDLPGALHEQPNEYRRMFKVNENFLKLKAGYLFPEIARRVNEFAAKQPDAKIIKLGIGDVTEPLPQAVADAMHKAVDDQTSRESFHGYGPEQGYAWLREKIAAHDYQQRGCDIAADEVFVSDGSKCDTGNILDILGEGNTVAVTDPVYPVYVDTNVMAGNSGEAKQSGEYAGLVYLPMTPDNDFTPDIPGDRGINVVYLCYPNNPTGATATLGYLENWVDYAREHNALILFDAAYEAFISDDNLPHSIYEVAGAKEVAIEFRSFSKNAGFTGTRCAWTVVPHELDIKVSSGERVNLHRLWNRRHCTKFNGVSYIVQRGAEAVYSPDGQKQVKQLVSFYMDNAKLIRETLSGMGLDVYGGVNAPYVWLKAPNGMGSWDLFDKLLSEAHVVGTPGAGFGAAGEGFFRISAFNSRAKVEEAMERVKQKLSV